MEEAFSEWISCSAHFNISLLPLMEVWWWSVTASDRRRLRSRAENPAHNAPVGAAWESDSSSQLVGSAPQQDGRTSGMWGEDRGKACCLYWGSMTTCKPTEVANCFLLVFAVSGPFTSRLAVCICFSWFSRSEVCTFVWGIFVRGLRVETFVRVLRSSRCRL